MRLASLVAELLGLLEFLRILNLFLVLIVDFHGEIGEDAGVEARPGDHDEDVDEVLQVGLRHDVAVAKASHRCYRVEYSVDVLLEGRHVAYVVKSGWSKIPGHDEPVLAVWIDPPNYKPDTSYHMSGQ